MRITRKGYFTIEGPDGELLVKPDGSLRQVTGKDEAYEYITEDGRAGIFIIYSPDTEVETEYSETPPIPPIPDTGIVVVLNGESEITIDVDAGETYTELGARVTTDAGSPFTWEDLEITVSGEIAQSWDEASGKDGLYEITYTATDNLGNTASEVRTLTINASDITMKAISGGTLTQPDSEPDPIAGLFVDETDVTASTTRLSNQIQILGVDSFASVTIEVSGDGGYRKNGSAATATPGTGVLGDLIALEHTSDATAGQSVNTTLTLDGTISDTFTSTTVSAATVDWDQKYTDAFTANTTGTTYWVSQSGSNSNGGLSKGDGFADIQYGISQMSGGDELIVEDGTYTNDLSMLINENGSSNNPTQAIPNGSAGAYTIIRAETPFGVRIESTNNSDYYGHYIGLRGSYVWVDGFIMVDDSNTYPETTISIDGTLNRITRVMCKRRQNDEYGVAFALDGTANLAQDCAAVGSGRYHFVCGPGSTSRQMFRRCVSRQDFGTGGEPVANYMLYSNENNNATINNHKQNCIAVDSNEIVNRSATYNVNYGAFYVRNDSNYNTHTGCIAVNNTYNSGADGGILYWEAGSSQDFEATDVVLWGNAGTANIPALWDENSSGNDADRFTIGQNTSTNFSLRLYGSPNNWQPTNSYLSDTLPANILDNTPGAVIKYAHGAFLSHEGDTGWNTVTTDRLWPYPYEDDIRTVFSEQMNSPSGYTPSTNDSTRGFCDPSVTSLTEYIHEFTGTQMNLADFYS